MATTISDRLKIFEICKDNVLAQKIIDELDSTEYVQVQDEGVNLPKRDTLNFTGNVQVTDVNQKTEVDIKGGLTILTYMSL